MVQINFQRGKRVGLAGAIVSTVFGLVFAGFAIFIGSMIGTSAWQHTQKRDSQDQVTATIQQSRVNVDKDAEHTPYTFEVTYTYQYGGKTYESSRFQPDYEGHAAYTDAATLTEKYAPGNEVTAYVDPEAPDQAELPDVTNDRWLGIILGGGFLLIFVGVGLGIPITAWTAYIRQRRGDEGRSISKEGDPRRQGLLKPLGLAGFFLIFFLAGAGAFYGFFLSPALDIMAAADWSKKQAVVERSTIVTERTDEGVDYEPSILYRYEHDGEMYRSERVWFGKSSSDHDTAEKLTEAYPVGERIICYVNPQAPREAVLKRGWHWGLALGGGLGAVFMLVGLGGSVGTGIYTYRQRRKASAAMSSGVAGATGEASTPTRPMGGRAGVQGEQAGDPVEAITAAASNWHVDADMGNTLNIQDKHLDKQGPVTLDPGGMRRKGFLGVLAFAILWNGIVWTAGYFIAIQPMLSGENLGFGFLEIGFGAIFVLVGLGLIGGAIYLGLRLMNPLIKIELEDPKVPLGQPLRFNWWIEGNPAKLQKLTMTLRGREEATYQRGTNTHTSKEQFAELPILSLGDHTGLDQREGEQEAIIPEKTMHSFVSDWNKIVWLLEVHGDIPRWPDIKDTYVITVLPNQPNRS